jgi:hypothetical protein
MPLKIRTGFTLIETAAVVAIGTLVATQLMPIARHARSQARGMSSANNLAMIGQAAGMYGIDNADRIPTYSWEGPTGPQVPRYTLPDGSIVVARDDQTAASAQMTEILQRRTGRIDGDFRILFNDSRIPQRRFAHLILQDYTGSPLGDAMFIDPADANLQTWTQSPLDYGVGSTVPYANGDPAPGYDQDANWSNVSVRQRWAFGSSYHAVPASWQADGFPGTFYSPISSTPHLFMGTAAGVELSDGRRFSEVRFPTAKVYFFEEHDREQAGDPYFGYDQAQVEKLMFDGSVNAFASGDAAASINPNQPGSDGKLKWRQTYVPLDTFPVPLAGLGDDTLISQRFRWTLGGLQGVDYTAPISAPGRPVGRSR